MNKARRKALEEIADRLSVLMAELDSLKDEEEEYRDNMPENLQDGERYEKADSACSSLGDAIADLESAIGSVEEAIGS